MATFTKGEVVLIPFPFSDLTQNKLRPALILASLNRGDFILCQITSQAFGDSSTFLQEAIEALVTLLNKKEK